MTLNINSGKVITLEDQPVKRGGEGAIYRVTSGAVGSVAKIYHTPEKAAAYEKKIRYMVENSPLENAPPDVANTIIWPREMIIDKGKFKGYIMPMVSDGIKLFSFNQANFPQAHHPEEWQKFHFNHSNALQKRMIVCYNLARAINFLHDTGKYLLVDMKPENILVKPNGHIALIDLDSIQICKGKKILFPSTAFTPEYAPPEFHDGKTDFALINKNYDNFSLAVILYQVLMSVHPFQASHPVHTAVHENIKHGLYVHGTRKKELHRIPLLHRNLRLLPSSLRLLFHKTFKKGHDNPRLRTSAATWAEKLLYEINNFNASTAPLLRETTLAVKGKKLSRSTRKGKTSPQQSRRKAAANGQKPPEKETTKIKSKDLTNTFIDLIVTYRTIWKKFLGN